MKKEQKTTLVLGGTGKTGSRVTKRLRARGVPVRVASRSAAPPFDWADARTWPAAVEGVDAVYVAYHPDLGAPGAAETVGALARLAVDVGARRIVLLSGRGEPQAAASERAVRETGAELTVLRAAFFCQNFSEGLFLGSVRDGTIAFPAGDVAEPFIDADDLADVAVAALSDDAHVGATYDLTGPRLVTFAHAAAEIAAATGRAVGYVAISVDELRAALAGSMPPETLEFLCELFPALLDGHNAHLSGDVERILGRAPRDFRAFAMDAARAGVWAP